MTLKKVQLEQTDLANSYTDADKFKVSLLKATGGGTKYLSDNGTYQTIKSGVLTVDGRSGDLILSTIYTSLDTFNTYKTSITNTLKVTNTSISNTLQTLTTSLNDTIQTLNTSIITTLDTHTTNRNNPHNVTATQINTYTKEEIDAVTKPAVIYISTISTTIPTVATSGTKYFNALVNTLYVSDGSSWIEAESVSEEALFLVTSTSDIYYKANNTLVKSTIGADGLLYTDKFLYLTKNGEIVSEGIYLATGGDTETFTLTNNLPDVSFVLSTADTFTLNYTYRSVNYFTATATYAINGITYKTLAISNGTYTFDATPYLLAGDNIVTVTIKDSKENVRILTYTITLIDIKLASTFDSSLIYTSDVTFKYTPTGTISKTIYMVLDDTTTVTTVSTTGRTISLVFGNLSHGVHTLTLYATSSVNNVTITSNTLYYEFLYVKPSNTEILIASEFLGTTYMQGDLVSIPYEVYDPANSITDVSLYINDELQKTLSVDRTKQVWNNYVQDYGTVTYKIVCGATTREFTVEVTKLNIDIEPVSDNLQLHLTAINRSNADANKNVWEYGSISTNFSNFNWINDGWILDSNNISVLRLANNARAEVLFKPFTEDFRINGKTIEIEFSIHDIIEETDVVMDCISNGRGFQITGQSIIFTSEQLTSSLKFKEDEKIRISFVIEPLSEHRLLRTYVNGILSNIKQYPSDDDFSQATPVNIKMGSSSSILDIYAIRVYSTALSTTDILNNYIGDTISVRDKLDLYSRNDVYNEYGEILYNKVLQQLPCMILTGDLPVYKGDKKKVQVDFENAQDTNRSFSRTNVTLDIQGTSSQYYPKKNYKISKFSTSYALREGAIPETTFTCKTDYMESSHAHNTGIAKILHTLYDDKVPPQVTDARVRTTVDGFPIAMFYRPTLDDYLEYFGVFNFNNDKGNNNTYGFTAGCESWEYKNNTADRCLFKSRDFSDSIAVLNDLEARYPDSYTDYTNLSKLYDWVMACDKDTATNTAITATVIDNTTYTVDSVEYRMAKFKAEYENHFNKNFLLIYYIVAEFLGMIDSRAKNMFLNTYDGDIWYPVFYDMDTAMGLNNEGVNNFSYNIEFHDTIGTLNVYNGEGSALWNMVEATLYDEIKNLYNELRGDKRLSYEALMDKFYGEQISKICEAQYNTEAEFKYISPLIDENTGSYLYCAQGSRLYHIEWWLYNRFKYMDSKYTSADYSDKYLTMRLYTPSTWQEVAPDAQFNITPAMDEYVTVQYASYLTRKRGYKGQVTNIPAPDLAFNDTETIIYGADRISDIGDLSPLYAGSIDVSKAVKLTSLKIGAGGSYTNTNLTHLSLGNNTLITNIDVRNCPNLAGVLDLSGCTSITNIDAGGTSITSVKLPLAGSLTKLYLPNTITNLTIKNQTSLTDFYIAGYDSIGTLVLENVSIDSLEVFNACTNLNKVRLVNIEWSVSSIEILDTIYDLLGVDINGYNTNHGVITGTLYITTEILLSTIQEYEEKFPDLIITAVSYAEEDIIYDDSGNTLITDAGEVLIYTEVTT